MAYYITTGKQEIEERTSSQRTGGIRQKRMNKVFANKRELGRLRSRPGYRFKLYDGGYSQRHQGDAERFLLFGRDLIFLRRVSPTTISCWRNASVTDEQLFCLLTETTLRWNIVSERFTGTWLDGSSPQIAAVCPSRIWST